MGRGTPEYLERPSFGRRLEPAGNAIVHGAGQSPEAFERYVEALAGTPPLVHMSYVGLRKRASERFGTIARELERWGERGLWLIPQIGLSMTTDGRPEEHYEHEVAEGRRDEEIAEVCECLAGLGRPAYLRIGYEFNGHWNGYAAEPYVAAWRRIAAALERRGLDEVARVWCYAPDGSNTEYAPFYPGDDVVDWWAIDLFSVEHFSAPHSVRFVEDALARRFPVMIGESTPRYVGVLDGARSFERWFAPCFGFMARHPAVKAFCYINWDWAPYPKWSSWGDGRVEANAEVLALYREAVGARVFLHGSDERSAREALFARAGEPHR